MPISDVSFFFDRWLLHDEAHVYPTTTKIWQEENKDEISVVMLCHLILKDNDQTFTAITGDWKSLMVLNVDIHVYAARKCKNVRLFVWSK